MRPILPLLLGVSALAITSFSCTKEAHTEARQQTEALQVIKANLSANETYTLNLGVGASASIRTQAAHYQVSELAKGSDGSLVYKYSGGKGFTGTDEVTLQQTTNVAAMQSSGCGHSGNGTNYTTEVKTMVVKFTVLN